MTKLADDILSIIYKPFPDVGLTPREQEVSSLVVRGLSQPDIGARLGISTSTVKTYVFRVKEKTGHKSEEWTTLAIRQIEKLCRGEKGDVR